MPPPPPPPPLRLPPPPPSSDRRRPTAAFPHGRYHAGVSTAAIENEQLTARHREDKTRAQALTAVGGSGQEDTAGEKMERH